MARQQYYNIQETASWTVFHAFLIILITMMLQKLLTGLTWISFRQGKNGGFPFALMNGRRKKFQTSDTGRVFMTRVPVLSPAEAEANVRRFAIFLAGQGIIVNNHENLRNALIPKRNLVLALAGDSAQRLVLIRQWTKDGDTDNEFFQEKVFKPVGTNDYQADMALKHELDQYMFATEEFSKNHHWRRKCPTHITFGYKTLADTMEALMGAIYVDGDNWTENLQHLMKVFELDIDAASRWWRNKGLRV